MNSTLHFILVLVPHIFASHLRNDNHDLIQSVDSSTKRDIEREGDYYYS